VSTDAIVMLKQDHKDRRRAGLGRRQLRDLGAKMAELRPKAPRRPSDPAAVRSARDAVTA
jgi:hypothetical protein